MPSDLRACPGSARSADELNALIRQLWADPRVRLDPVRRREYELLSAEWVAAVRDEVAPAALL